MFLFFNTVTVSICAQPVRFKAQASDLNSSLCSSLLFTPEDSVFLAFRPSLCTITFSALTENNGALQVAAASLLTALAQQPGESSSGWGPEAEPASRARLYRSFSSLCVCVCQGCCWTLTSSWPWITSLACCWWRRMRESGQVRSRWFCLLWTPSLCWCLFLKHTHSSVFISLSLCSWL